MAQLKIPDTPDTYITKYADLLGVDYQSDSTEVSKQRSPDMVNMISDLGGNPIKRKGYRRIGMAYAGFAVVDGEYWAVKNNELTNYVEIVKIDITNGEIVESTTKFELLNLVLGTAKKVFGFQSAIYIMCENGWVKADVTNKDITYTGIKTNLMCSGNLGESAPANPNIIPTVVISLNPDGTGGETAGMEGKNLMSIYQMATYVSDGTATEYTIPYYQTFGSYLKVEVMDSEGAWQEKTLGKDYTITGQTTMTGVNLEGTEAVTSNVIGNKITFADAPSKPVVAGQDNVRITFAPFNTTDKVELNGTEYNRGFYNPTFLKLMNSNAQAFFDSRMFIGVGVHTYYSRVNKPFNIDDNGYFDVDNTVMAYTRTSSYLAVITKDTGTNTIYLASGSYSDTTQQVVFSVKPSNAGVGAITNAVGGTLNDEPIFLASTGLYGISTNYLSEKYAINRSGKINRKMCKEENLENAVGCPFNNYYYIAINGNMYVLDGRHRNSSKNGDNSYEAYFFDNMPIITHMYVLNKQMFFTDDTYTYTWNDDIEETYHYLDNAVKSGGIWRGTPVKAKWCSKWDDDNYPHYLKILSKKGTMVSIDSELDTSCDITLCKDGTDEIYLGTWDAGKFKYSEVALDAFTRKKVKKYKRLQIKVENNEAEPFGLTSVVKTYTLGNYAKR